MGIFRHCGRLMGESIWGQRYFVMPPCSAKADLGIGISFSHLIHFAQHVLKWGTRLSTFWALGCRNGGDRTCTAAAVVRGEGKQAAATFNHTNATLRALGPL
jgi:hypothetical protein